jgi:glycerate 2-kinase
VSRKHALRIFHAALKAADPEQAVLRHLRREGDTLVAGRRRYRLSKFDRIQVIGAGKASAAMAHAVERVLGRRISGGVINVQDGQTARLRRIALNPSGHPVPDERGVEGSRRILEIARAAGPRDLLICVISGGASALMPAPAPPNSLAAKQAATRQLLACGATIHEINTVRKHISQVKGGQLAKVAAPATVLALILSDVIGDDLDVIGSGLTAPDASTFSSAKAVLEKYSLLDRVPSSIGERLAAGARGEIRETPKAGDPAFARTQNLIVGSNRLAVEAAAAHARERGFRTMILATSVEGETRDVARMHAAIASEIARYGRPLAPPACVISGGETTVTLRGPGLGGRNQEFVLAAAIDIAGLDRTVVLSGGTDGTDGPTNAAGAIADGQTLARGPGARESLAANDSYHYFEKLDDLLITGPTNTNVMDVHIVLVGARP